MPVLRAGVRWFAEVDFLSCRKLGRRRVLVLPVISARQCVGCSAEG
ncbi:hypothetical protein [Streptomyces sp. NPDC093544]